MLEIASTAPVAGARAGSDIDHLPLVDDVPFSEFGVPSRQSARRSPGAFAESTPFGVFSPTPLQRLLVGLGSRTPLGRGRARWWMASLIEQLRAGPLDVQRFGLKLRLHYHRDACDKKILLHIGGCDSEELDCLTREMSSCFRFVDVGAHTGLYSLAVKSKCPTARIVAFEPHPLYCERLAYNVWTNGLNDFSIRREAVGAENGVSPYYPDHGSLYCIDQRGSGKGRFFNVPVVPLHDGLQAEGFDGVDALKIDIEGYEDRALFPFFDSAPRCMWPRLIIIEHTLRHWWERDCFKLCAALGYRQIFAGKVNVVLKLG